MTCGKQENFTARRAQVVRSITTSDAPALQASQAASRSTSGLSGLGGVASLGACLLLPATGCSPRLDPETYGEVVHTLPVVPGAEEPYPLPELTEGEPPKTPAK